MASDPRRLVVFRSVHTELPAERISDPGHSGPPRPGPGRGLLNDDFRDILGALEKAGADFIVVGAHAMAVHGVPRATGDLDIWVRPEPENASKVWQALLDFGAPVATMGLSPNELANPGIVFQIGLPPRRVDLLTEIDGVSFEEAWISRVTERIGDLKIPFLSRDVLLRNKRASGRPKDLADAALLERIDKD